MLAPQPSYFNQLIFSAFPLVEGLVGRVRGRRGMLAAEAGLDKDARGRVLSHDVGIGGGRR